MLRATLGSGLQETEVDALKVEFEEGRRREDPSIDVVWAGMLCLVAANCACPVSHLDGEPPAAQLLSTQASFSSQAGTGVGLVAEELPAAEIIGRLVRAADAAVVQITRRVIVPEGVSARA